MNNVVFVLDTEKRPLTPCRPAQARRLLREGKAAVFRRFPFTLILKEARPDAVVKPLAVKIDPGAKTTGLALVDASRVLFAAELAHRGGAIKSALDERRVYRRNRRARKTRHRAARFDNRVRGKRELAGERPVFWWHARPRSRVVFRITPKIALIPPGSLKAFQVS